MKDKKAKVKKISSQRPFLNSGLYLGCAVSITVLGLWHLTDVRAGALETGCVWLYGWYAALFVASAFLLLFLWYGMEGGRRWRYEKLYACMVMGLGLIYLLVLPPLSAPDEVSHFISAYQLSNHIMGKTANAPDGRVYIRAQDAFIEDMLDVMEDDGSGFREAPVVTEDRESSFRDMPAAMESGEGNIRKNTQSENDGHEAAVVLGQDLTQDTYSFIKAQGLLGEREDGRAVSYQPPVRTTPLAYAPQALGITLARVVGLGGLGLLYMGRLMNLLFFTVMGCLTVRRMPFGREVVTGVSLLPMTLHLASSFSYDVMILSLSFYFTAVCLDLAYRAESVRLRDVAVLALIMAVMGPCKMVYGVIAGFCLLIPVKKFGGGSKVWLRWGLSAATVLGAFACAMFLVNHQTVAMYTEASEGYIAWAGEAGYTFSQLVHNPVLVLKMCYNTLMWQGEQLYSGMLGSALGNMDPVLNTPYWAILGMTAVLLTLSFRKPGERIYMNVKNRVWVWFLCLVCLGALMFSMLLAWTPVGSQVINGVQGRYLLPLLPIFLLTLKNDCVVRTDCNDRILYYLMVSMDLFVALRIFSVVCLRV